MKKKKLLSIMLMICMILSVTIPSIPGGGVKRQPLNGLMTQTQQKPL